MGKIDLTPILALWGTIVSTIAITWNIIRSLNDRKKIKIEAYIGHYLPGNPKQVVFYVTLTNVGRRPVWIVGWGVRRKRKKEEDKEIKPAIFIPSPRLPSCLKDGDFVTLDTEDISIFRNDITEVHAYDSVSKYWKISKKNLRRLLKTASEVLTNTSNSQSTD